MMKQFEIWIADLNPQIGTEPGKARPVVIIQTNLLNKRAHPSTIICPITTNIKQDANILRIHLRKGMGDLAEDCSIMMDQIRAIDNKRFLRKVGDLPIELEEILKENLLIILDLD